MALLMNDKTVESQIVEILKNRFFLDVAYAETFAKENLRSFLLTYNGVAPTDEWIYEDLLGYLDLIEMAQENYR